MQTFEVTGRSMTHNGKQLKVGDKIRLSAGDGAALASRGRVKPATEAAKKATEIAAPAAPASE